MSFKKEFLYGFVIPSVLLLSTSVVALEDDATVGGEDGQPLRVMQPVHREPTDPIGMGSGGLGEVDDADAFRAHGHGQKEKKPVRLSVAAAHSQHHQEEGKHDGSGSDGEEQDGRTRFPETWTGRGHAAASHEDGPRRGSRKEKAAAHGKKTPPRGVPVLSSDDEDDQQQRGQPAKAPKPRRIGGSGGLAPQYADHDDAGSGDEEIFVPSASGHPTRQDDVHAAPRDRRGADRGEKPRDVHVEKSRRGHHHATPRPDEVGGDIFAMLAQSMGGDSRSHHYSGVPAVAEDHYDHRGHDRGHHGQRDRDPTVHILQQLLAAQQETNQVLKTLVMLGLRKYPELAGSLDDSAR